MLSLDTLGVSDNTLVIPENEGFELGVKQKNAYRIILGGLYKGRFADKQTLFVTLTSSNEVDDDSSIRTDFIQARKRINRLTPRKLVESDFITKRQSGQFYGGGSDDLRVFEDLQYFNVFTSEGNGVIHSLMRCEYIPKDYIACLWNDVHSSSIVNVQYVNYNRYSIEDTAGYLVAQYCAVKQGSDFLGYSMSKNWLFNGHTKLWNDLKCKHLQDWDKYDQRRVSQGNFRWYHPYYKGEESKIPFQNLLDDWYKNVAESVENPNFKYPPEKKNVNDLSDIELEKLELDVINSQYKVSRLNPQVSQSKKKPNLYCKFIEDKFEQKKIKHKDHSLDEFYKVNEYANLDEDGNYI